MAIRVDVGSLRPPKRYGNRLRVDGVLTRAGVFEYRNPDGSIRREYRPAEQVFAAESMATFECAPVTNNHPPCGLVKGDEKVVVGSITESIRQDGDLMIAGMVIHDADTIKQMEAGKVELSCGYECDLIESPGATPSGERYDAIQSNIRGNHVAIVDVARAGRVARVRMDATVQVDKEGFSMNLEEALKKIGELEAAVSTQTKRADSAEAEAANQKDRADKAEAETAKVRTDSQARFDAEVKERVSLLATVKPILGEAVKADEMTSRELRLAVVKKVCNEDCADKSDDYLAARFKGAVENAVKSDAALAAVRPGAAVHTDTEDKEEIAKAKRKAELESGAVLKEHK